MLSEHRIRERIGGEHRSRVSDLLATLIRSTSAENACVIFVPLPVQTESEKAGAVSGQILFWHHDNPHCWPDSCALNMSGSEGICLLTFSESQFSGGQGIAEQASQSDAGYFYLAAYFPHQQISDYDSAFISLSAERLSNIIHQVAEKYEENLRLLQDRLSLFDTVSEMAETGGWDSDMLTGHIHWTNETYRLFDFSKDSPVTLHRILGCFSPDGRQRLLRAIRNLVFKGVNYQLELPVVTRKKHHRWLKLSGKGQSEEGRIVRIFGSVQDITEQKRLSATEQNYTEYLNTILNNINDAVLTVDEFGTIITANNTVLTVFGHHPDYLMGQDVSALLPGTPEDADSEFVHRQLLPGQGELAGKELNAKHSSGRLFPVEFSVAEVQQAGYSQFVCVFRDITERKQALDSIYNIAFFDEVTHLPNAKSLEKDLRKLIIAAATSNKQMYCCMLDIDNFAQFNLSFGKETGDYILRIFAGRLKKAVSSRFQIYSGLGDKFYIVYKSPFDSERDHNVMELIDTVEWNVHAELGKEFSLHGHSQNVPASLASTYVHGQDASYEKVIGILEFGTRRAKKQGPGGRVTLERNEFNAYDRHNYISQSFQQALENNEFYLVLQPQYDRHGKIVSSEALLRWNEKRLGFISPGEFIPIAEESDAVVDIGYWVINEACRLLFEMKAKGLETSLSVNISGRHIARADFSNRLLDSISEWQINPCQLILEITETTLVTTIDIVRKRIERLSQLGFAFSIDDFGTGYSSLSYLKELPIRELKIDRYFVDEINFESDESPIVNTIIDMASAMGLRTVAEGIENEIQIRYLMQRGCDIYQGFYLSRPVEEEVWRTLITDAAAKKLSIIRA